MLKRHIQSWSQDSYEDSDVLPCDTSAGTLQSPPKAPKTQVPEKKKKKIILKSPRCCQKHFPEFKIPFTVWYYIHFLLHQQFSHAGNLPSCSSAKKLSPSPCHWSFKESSHVTSHLYLSPSTPGRIYYYLLWDFAKIVYWYLSWVPTNFLVGITQSLLREQRSGASLSKGHLKNLSWGTSATVITTSHYH